jgi:CHAD domain-containing protein
MLEEERKYEVEPKFALPDLTGALPSGSRVQTRDPVSLRATYYDTADLRLARAGASLRYRRGDREPWTVKLPTDVPGIRHEISRPGIPQAIPAELVALVTAYTGGRPLGPALVMRTQRRVHDLVDGADRPLAELADDLVVVLDGKQVRMRFREIEVERREAGRKVLDRIDAAMRDAGAVTGTFVPKHVRGLGGVGGPVLIPPSGALSKRATAGEVVVEAIRAGIGRMVAHDPLVRLRTPLPDGDTAVHQMRVGCRRLRSDLRTFRPLLDPAWAAGLRAELSWIADILGGARDAEVLRARLRRTAGADPLAPLDDASVARIDADLAARHEDSLTALDKALASDRYLALLDLLVAAAAAPKLVLDRSDRPARELLPRLVAKPWRQLAYGSDGVTGAGALDRMAPDDDWHEVRIRGKRARYATEAVAGVLGGAAAELGKALARVQNLLGEHQDAVVAAQTWLGIARADPDDHALAVTAGRLVERERAVVREVRDAFPDAWAATDRRRLTEWLP